MFCANCGHAIDESAKYCEQCGAPVDGPAVGAAGTPPPPASGKPKRPSKPVADAPASEGTKVSPNITLGPDGKYRWTYVMDLFRNPTVFLLVWKVMLIACLVVFGFVILVDACTNDLTAERLLSDLKIGGIMIAVMSVLSAISMLVYAVIMGGKYIIDFEMDEKGINHAQTPAQAKKARKLAAVTTLAGAASGRLSTVGAGMAASRTEMYTEFARVKKVVPLPRRDVIKLNQTLHRNQVYARPEDFDFVLSFILAHTPSGK